MSRTQMGRTKSRLLVGLAAAITVVAGLIVPPAAQGVAGSPTPAAPIAGDTRDTAWTMSTTDPSVDYSPTFVGNGYLAARVPAEGAGFSKSAATAQAQVAGFYAHPPDSVEERASLPMWTTLGFSDGSATFGNVPVPAPECQFGTNCEAEDTQLSGGAMTSSDDAGASGGAFVRGFYPPDAAATLKVVDVSAGTATLTVRYANAMGGARTLSVVVNGADAGKVTLAPTANWSTWSTATVQVPVTAGTNTIALAADDTYTVNVDYFGLSTVGAPAPAPPLAPSNGTTSNYRQTLDLRRGTLTTSLTWTSPAGRVTDLRYDVIAARARAHVGAVHLTMKPHWSGTATAKDIFDARPAKSVTASNAQVDAAAGRLRETVTAAGTNAVASLVSRLQTGGAPAVTSAVQGLSAQSAGQQTTLAVQAGRTYTVTKYVGLATSIDLDRGHGTAAAAALQASNGAASTGWDALLTEHKDAWAKLWGSDISVPGNDRLTRQARASMFYLLESTRAGVDWSLSPGGLSSDGYYGHVFWDAETWMYPSLLAQHPDIAVGVNTYRQRLLPGAKANAVATGWQGARFPWESASKGDEQTPADASYEIHIIADVALAQWQYYQATGDKKWLATKAWPVLEGGAQFWTSRVTPNGSGGYDIDDVLAADEYSGRVDNNAYTNVAAATALRIATQAAQVLGKTPDPRWATIADGIVVPLDPKLGIHTEYTGYSGQTLKQADVVMLQYPWRYPMPDSVAQANLDYYAPRSDVGGPSMTDAIHAIDTAELGTPGCASHTFLERSVDPFMRAPFNQFSEDRHGGAFTFTTGAGGFLQTFLYGFTGMRWSADAVQLDPMLPPQLPGVELTGLAWQGRRFDISIGPKTTKVTLVSGDPMPVQVADGATRTVRTGATLSVATRRPDLAPTTDLARCAPVTSSSADLSYPAGAAVDGSAATHWRPTSDGGSLIVDFGSVRTVRRGTVVSATGHTTGYTLEGSTDATTWRSIGTVTAGSNPTSSVDVAPTDVRFVRYTAAAGTAPQVTSLEVFDTSTP